MSLLTLLILALVNKLEIPKYLLISYFTFVCGMYIFSSLVCKCAKNQHSTWLATPTKIIIFTADNAACVIIGSALIIDAMLSESVGRIHEDNGLAIIIICVINFVSTLFLVLDNGKAYKGWD